MAPRGWQAPDTGSFTRRGRTWLLRLAGAGLWCAASAAQAQTAPPPNPPPAQTPPAQTPAPSQNAAETATHEEAATFRTHVNLVMVPVVVRDRKGKAIGNLTRQDFQLFDKGKPQEITRFSVEKPGEMPKDAAPEPQPACGPGGTRQADRGAGQFHRLPVRRHPHPIRRHGADSRRGRPPHGRPRPAGPRRRLYHLGPGGSGIHRRPRQVARRPWPA